MTLYCYSMKPGMDINTAHSYRPMSNLSFLSKLLERVVCGQIQSFIDLHSLLPHCQSAYRRGFSTETALVKVYADLITALDSNTDSQAVLTLLDMTAAFDTVDHSILLQCMQRSYLVTRWHGSHLTWLPGNSLFSLEINSPLLSCSSRGPARIRLRTTSV